MRMHPGLQQPQARPQSQHRTPHPRLTMSPLRALLLFALLLQTCSSAPSVDAIDGTSSYVPWLQQLRSGLMPASSRAASDLPHRVLAETNPSSSWKTLTGDPPFIIANGGSSGLFPDQTVFAYSVAASYSLPGSALTCDIQLTKDGIDICRTGIDLGASTNINLTLPNLTNTYTVNGQPVDGFFAIDLTAAELSQVFATQANHARSPAFDGLYPIYSLVNVSNIANATATYVWVNVEYYSFFLQHKLDIAAFIVSGLNDPTVFIDYISSPEIAFLKAIQAKAPKINRPLVFKFHDKEELEPTTNVTYGSLLSNLTYIATFASGILVPKDFIWPLDTKTNYLQPQTTLVQEAHDAGLAVYASGFVNDEASSTYVPIYNYSFDPVREYLQYLPDTGPIVDGFMTDFPTTASESVACFKNATSSKESALETKPLVISHNGASGDFPGCTLLAYKGAVEAGASYIDCAVQMTKDGVAICRESPDLITNTDVGTHSDFLSRLTTIPALQSAAGIFTFNFTWDEINTLKAISDSPEGTEYGIFRNRAFDGQENIVTLSDFLAYAKNISSVGILIDIQNGYFLETNLRLGVVDAVLNALSVAGLGTSDRVLVQSEDSAVLQRIKLLKPGYQLVYRVADYVNITKVQIEQIKSLAPSVTLPRNVIQDTTASFLLNATDVVDLFHASNMSVFVSYLRNEFVTIPFDYEADPVLEISTMVQIFKVDGLITDFPATARAYLNNACLNAPGAFNYSMRKVIPGDLLYNVPLDFTPPTTAPIKPTLNVTENEAALGPISSIPAPNPPPASAPSSPSHSAPLPHVDSHVLLLTISIVIILLASP